MNRVQQPSVLMAPDWRLVGAHPDLTLRIWDWRNGRQVAECSGFKDKVWAIAFSPDGKLIATGSYDHSVRLWDAKSGAAVRQFGSIGERANSVTFSPDGTKLAAAYDKGTLIVWDLKSGVTVFKVQHHNSDVNSVAYSPDGKLMASGSKDRTIAIIDASSGRLLNRLSGHTKSAYHLVFSPNGIHLASCGIDGTVKFWDMCPVTTWLAPIIKPFTQPAVKATVAPEVAWWWNSVGVVPPSGVLHIAMLNKKDRYIADVGRSIDNRQLVDGALIQSYGELARPVPFMVSADGTLLAYSLKGNILVKNAETGDILQKIPVPCEFMGLTFSPDSKRIYAGGWGPLHTTQGDDDSPVCAFDLKDGSILWKSSSSTHIHVMGAIAASPDGKQIWTGGFDRFLPVWDASNGKLLETLGDQSPPISCIRFSPDGKLVASADDVGLIQLWDSFKRKPLFQLSGHKGRVSDLAFHPTEPRLVSVGVDGNIRVWDTRDGTELLKIEVAESPRFTNLLNQSSQFSDINALDISSGRTVPTSLAFSPDGSSLLVGDMNSRIWTWNAGKPSCGFPPLQPQATAIASPEDNDSNDPHALNELAWKLATSDAYRDGKRAIQLARKACELTLYQNAHIVDTLAAAYAEAGDFDAAIRWSEESIHMLDDPANKHELATFTCALERYKAKKPMREGPSQQVGESTSPQSTSQGPSDTKPNGDVKANASKGSSPKEPADKDDPHDK